MPNLLSHAVTPLNLAAGAEWKMPDVVVTDLVFVKKGKYGWPGIVTKVNKTGHPKNIEVHVVGSSQSEWTCYHKDDPFIKLNPQVLEDEEHAIWYESERMLEVRELKRLLSKVYNNVFAAEVEAARKKAAEEKAAREAAEEARRQAITDQALARKMMDEKEAKLRAEFELRLKSELNQHGIADDPTIFKAGPKQWHDPNAGVTTSGPQATTPHNPVAAELPIDLNDDDDAIGFDD